MVHHDKMELKQTTTETWTRKSSNKRFNEQNNSSVSTFLNLGTFPDGFAKKTCNDQLLCILEEMNDNGLIFVFVVWRWTLSLHIQLELAPKPIETLNTSG